MIDALTQGVAGSAIVLVGVGLNLAVIELFRRHGILRRPQEGDQ